MKVLQKIRRQVFEKIQREVTGHEIVYFAVARGLVGLSLQWSWPHELLSGVANAIVGVFVYFALDRLKQRT